MFSIRVDFSPLSDLTTARKLNRKKTKKKIKYFSQQSFIFFPPQPSVSFCTVRQDKKLGGGKNDSWNHWEVFLYIVFIPAPLPPHTGRRRVTLRAPLTPRTCCPLEVRGRGNRKHRKLLSQNRTDSAPTRDQGRHCLLNDQYFHQSDLVGWLTRPQPRALMITRPREIGFGSRNSRPQITAWACRVGVGVVEVRGAEGSPATSSTRAKGNCVERKC